MKGLEIRSILLVSIFSTVLLSGCRDFSVNKINDSIVDNQALVLGDVQYGVMRFGNSINGQSFQQDALITYNNYQYLGYYDGNRHVCVARRELPEGRWEIIRFKNYVFTVNDAHNTISLGICPADGSIHLAFDHHANELHYRISKVEIATHPESVEWDVSLFGDILTELEKGIPVKSITYQRFVQTPDGGLQLFYRRSGSANGNRMVVDYDPSEGLWRNTRQIDSHLGNFSDDVGESSSRGSYPNGYTYGPDKKLHTTWVWREKATQGSNHDLMYAYSTDGGFSWCNNAGETLINVISLNSPEIKVADISRKYGLMNTHGQSVDSEGHIHTVMWHCSDETFEAAGVIPLETRWGSPAARRYHHYWRADDGIWQHRELPVVAGNRPKLFLDKNNNAYLIYGSKMSSASMEREVYFTEGELVIMAATAKAEWNDWKVIHTEKGPFMNEMLGDTHRWNEDEILSVMVQESPEKHEPTTLRILDFKLR